MLKSVAICNIACPQAEIGNFVFISNGLAINWRRLLNDLVRPFCVCTWATGYSIVISMDVQ